MPDEAETKLSAARTRLILDRPFLGALVLRLPSVEGDPAWCKTTATDARAFYYNRRYVNALGLDELQFVLAHEALHCALSHFARRQHRARHRWDLACDLAVNPLLINEGLKPTPDALYMEEFEGMTAEEIYPSLDDSSEDQPQDQHLYDGRTGSPPPPAQGGGSGQAGTGAARGAPPPLTETERQRLSVQWQQRLAGAAQQAIQAGKMGAAMARMVDHLLQPQLPWRMLLARYMSALARDDYSYARPSRREGDAILPSLRSTQLDLVVVIDTSGSIGDRDIEAFLGEVNAIKGQLSARLTLHACDAALCRKGPWTYEPWEQVRFPAQLGGGGGTSFRPAFDWAASLDRAPDLLIYFTDAQGEFPEHRPPFPVLWLVKGKAVVPWGRRVQLN